MLLPSMGYINNTLDYLKGSLDTIKSTLTGIREILGTVGNVIGTIVDILGFIGFRVFILLLITSFILWFLNLVSPISKKTNYFIGVGLVLWLAIENNMPTQVVILKYIIIITAPFLITFIANFFVNNSTKFYKIIYQKLLKNFSKYNFNFFKKRKNYSLDFNDNISLLFTFDLPTLDQIKEIKELMKCWQYNLIIFEEEKISLVDNNKKIIFSNEYKINQFIKSIKSREIKLLWFWSSCYGSNELLNYLEKSKKLSQNKLIIGGADNSFILNFLQEKWNWEVIYGNNLKEFAIKENQKPVRDIIESSKSCDLILINDYVLEENYIMKNKIVGGDLSVLVSEFNNNPLNFKNKILFLDVIVENKKNLYSLLNQLQNYIFNENVLPKSIVFGSLILNDLTNNTEIIQHFNEMLKNKNLIVPIFQIKDFDFVKLNAICTIEYKNGVINLKIV